MAIDPYSPCPCGSGKKVKFCCASLVGEIEKVQRMIEGEQTVACLQYIEQLEKKHPDHPYFLRVKAALQSRTGHEEQAAETLEQILGKDSADASAWAEKALLAAKQGEVKAAVEAMQMALDICDGNLTGPVANAIGGIGGALMAQGEVLAARGHLLLAASINQKNEHALGMLVQLNRAEQIPLLLKYDFTLRDCPDGAPWKADFDDALLLFRKGRWASAAKEFTDISHRADSLPEVWHNLAALRAWLADTDGAASAWRKLAILDVPLEEAVEAEALAQLIDPDGEVDFIDIMGIEYTARDFDSLEPRLASDPLCIKVAAETEATDDDDPPPRAAFLLLDRPMPDSGAGLEIADVPVVIGEMYLYPRQTDREARLELHVMSSQDVERAVALVSDLAGETLEAPGEPKVSGQTPAAHEVLNWRWRLPRDTPPDHVHKLVAAKRRQVLLERWPDTPLDTLGGKTPREAAQLPETRIAALAAVLLLEQQMAQTSVHFDFNELRSALRLPETETIDSAEISNRQIPAHRLSRIRVENLPDDQLLRLFDFAQMMSAADAMRHLGREIVARSTLDEKLDKAQVYGLLASLEEDTARSLELLNSATALCAQSGESPARWLLQQLEVRLERGEAAEAGQLVTQIQSRHMKEPGVGQALYAVLHEAGIIGRDGRPASAAAAEPSLVASGSQTDTPSQLWTPDSEAPAGKKSALWTPGMD